MQVGQGESSRSSVTQIVLYETVYYGNTKNTTYKSCVVILTGRAATVVKNRAQGRRVDGEYRCLKLMKRDRHNTLKRKIRGLILARDGGDHENIIRFYEAWGQEGHLVMALELAATSLADILVEKGNRIPRTFKQIVARTVALGLQHIHTCGVVRRDIKPDSILLKASGDIKITDSRIQRPI
ncbi:hypothetical protein BGX29_000335 [Mortierella sp. GBA35]|nr:hypothetical protein BGX29_000335 [Mortierella sp. GBA35]